MVAIGIDFGTQWVTAATLVEGRPQLLGEPLAALATMHRDLVVGDVARTCAVSHPHASIDDVVRILGRKFHRPEVAWLRQLRPAAIVPAGNGDAWLRLADQPVAPERVAATLLRRVRKVAEARLGLPVREAAITVPAFAGQSQRGAVLAAAHIAGFERIRLVSAPACVALGAGLEGRGPVALLDLGAGCFDVTIAHREAARVMVDAVAGDTLFGLRDFDHRVVEHFVDAIERDHGVNAASDPRVVRWLRGAAEQVRLELDRYPRSRPVVAPALIAARGRRNDFAHEPLTRARYRDLVQEELWRLSPPCAWVLEDAGLGTDDLEAVILCGGGAESWLVVDHLESLFRRPVRLLRDRTAAARGAALVAAAQGAGAPIRDVAPHSLGLKGRGGRMTRVLGRNRPLPARGDTEVVVESTSSLGPSLLEVFEGESELVRDNDYVGRLVVDAPRGPRMRVELHLDGNGLVEGRLSCSSRGASLPLTPAGGLTVEQADRLRAQMPASVPSPRRSFTRPPVSRLSDPPP